MNKKDMVKTLYEKGILPSPKELESLSAEPHAIPLESRGSRLSVTPRKHERRKKLSPQDFIDYYNSKYEKIKAMLLKKIDAVSITNAKTDPSPCGIIGIVKNLTQAGFIFEDPTGELEVMKSSIRELEKISLDNVFGLRGFVRENRFFPKEIVWPGIPLNHRIGRIRGINIMLSKNPKEAACSLAISEGKTKNNLQIGETPEWIDITRGQDRVTFLAFKTKATKGEALFYLKRRCLPEPNPIKTTENPYLIEEIPDIVWLIQDDEWTENYRGITIISCGSQSLAKLDLGARTVEFGKI